VSGDGIEKLARVSLDWDELRGFIKVRVPISNEGRSLALPFLRVGAFAKLRKGSSCLPVCPFAWNNSAPTERTFMNPGI
jgi:hypothetical protein